MSLITVYQFDNSIVYSYPWKQNENHKIVTISISRYWVSSCGHWNFWVRRRKILHFFISNRFTGMENRFKWVCSKQRILKIKFFVSEKKYRKQWWKYWNRNCFAICEEILFTNLITCYFLIWYSLLFLFLVRNENRIRTEMFKCSKFHCTYYIMVCLFIYIIHNK